MSLTQLVIDIFLQRAKSVVELISQFIVHFWLVHKLIGYGLLDRHNAFLKCFVILFYWKYSLSYDGHILLYCLYFSFNSCHQHIAFFLRFYSLINLHQLRDALLHTLHFLTEHSYLCHFLFHCQHFLIKLGQLHLFYYSKGTGRRGRVFSLLLPIEFIYVF